MELMRIKCAEITRAHATFTESYLEEAFIKILPWAVQTGTEIRWIMSCPGWCCRRELMLNMAAHHLCTLVGKFKPGF